MVWGKPSLEENSRTFYRKLREISDKHNERGQKVFENTGMGMHGTRSKRAAGLINAPFPATNPYATNVPKPKVGSELSSKGRGGGSAGPGVVAGGRQAGSSSHTGAAQEYCFSSSSCGDPKAQAQASWDEVEARVRAKLQAGTRGGRGLLGTQSKVGGRGTLSVWQKMSMGASSVAQDVLAVDALLRHPALAVRMLVEQNVDEALAGRGPPDRSSSSSSSKTRPADIPTASFSNSGPANSSSSSPPATQSKPRGYYSRRPESAPSKKAGGAHPTTDSRRPASAKRPPKSSSKPTIELGFGSSTQAPHPTLSDEIVVDPTLQSDASVPHHRRNSAPESPSGAHVSEGLLWEENPSERRNSESMFMSTRQSDDMRYYFDDNFDHLKTERSASGHLGGGGGSSGGGSSSGMNPVPRPARPMSAQPNLQGNHPHSFRKEFQGEPGPHQVDRGKGQRGGAHTHIEGGVSGVLKTGSSGESGRKPYRPQLGKPKSRFNPNITSRDDENSDGEFSSQEKATYARSERPYKAGMVGDEYSDDVVVTGPLKLEANLRPRPSSAVSFATHVTEIDAIEEEEDEEEEEEEDDEFEMWDIDEDLDNSRDHPMGNPDTNDRDDEDERDETWDTHFQASQNAGDRRDGDYERAHRDTAEEGEDVTVEDMEEDDVGDESWETSLNRVEQINKSFRPRMVGGIAVPGGFQSARTNPTPLNLQGGRSSLLRQARPQSAQPVMRKHSQGGPSVQARDQQGRKENKMPNTTTATVPKVRPVSAESSLQRKLRETFRAAMMHEEEEAMAVQPRVSPEPLDHPGRAHPLGEPETGYVGRGHHSLPRSSTSAWGGDAAAGNEPPSTTATQEDWSQSKMGSKRVPASGGGRIASQRSEPKLSSHSSRSSYHTQDDETEGRRSRRGSDMGESSRRASYNKEDPPSNAPDTPAQGSMITGAKTWQRDPEYTKCQVLFSHILDDIQRVGRNWGLGLKIELDFNDGAQGERLNRLLRGLNTHVSSSESALEGARDALRELSEGDRKAAIDGCKKLGHENLATMISSEL